jgi:S-adenosylmethionine synthetase
MTDSILDGWVDQDALKRAATIFAVPQYLVLVDLILVSHRCPSTENIILESIKYVGPLASSVGWDIHKTTSMLTDLYNEGYSETLSEDEHCKPSAGVELRRRIALGIIE